MKMLSCLKLKKNYPKKEKVLESLSYANEIFNNEHNVFNALDALEIDSAFLVMP